MNRFNCKTGFAKHQITNFFKHSKILVMKPEINFTGGKIIAFAKKVAHRNIKIFTFLFICGTLTVMGCSKSAEVPQQHNPTVYDTTFKPNEDSTFGKPPIFPKHLKHSTESL